ncbi:helix-turn-helix domain-containing protein [Latilactobacillus sakei]
MENNVVSLGFNTTEATQKSIDNYLMSRFAEIVNIVGHRVTLERINIRPMDIQETCEFFKGISVPTLNGYVKKGLKKHKIGNQVYYLPTECLEYITKLPPE